MYDREENEYVRDDMDYWLFQDYIPNNLNFLDCLKDKLEIIEEKNNELRNEVKE